MAIVRACWPHLAELDLCKNQFGDEGVKELPNASWPVLRSIRLLESKGTTQHVFSGASFMRLIRCEWPFVVRQPDIQTSLLLNNA